LLNTLRHFAFIYVHGHSVGGTNPSLLEAMGCECRIAAHNNVFNKAVLEQDADYFSSAEEVKMILDTKMDEREHQRKRNQNLGKIQTIYNWEKIIDDYEQLFYSVKK